MCYLLIVIRYLNLVVYAYRAIIRSMFHLIYVGNCRFGVKQQNSINKVKLIRQVIQLIKDLMAFIDECKIPSIKKQISNKSQ